MAILRLRRPRPFTYPHRDRLVVYARSAGSAELVPPQFQPFAVWVLRCRSWHDELAAVVSLQTMLEHGPVDLPEMRR